jgi:uncharacterized protein YbjT (DUF2867 family)
MRILLTGATGYIGKRLLPALLDAGHHVVALVRRPTHWDILPRHKDQLTVFQADLLQPASLSNMPQELDAAYYLVHSMADSTKHFPEMEQTCITHFMQALGRTQVRQLIYLSGISNDKNLSTHLNSRKEVEQIIRDGSIPYTILKAGIIIGSGSASFEVIRDLVEKLPFMIAPKWVKNKTHPIAISDVLFYLQAVLNSPKALNQEFEIGGADQLTYEQMLKSYAKIRGMRRFILRVPVLTPRLSSYWLYFVTSTNFSLAYSLVDSLRNETICKDNRIRELFPHNCYSYEEAVRHALEKIEQNHVISSWKDALSVSNLNPDLQSYIQIPSSGCLTDTQQVTIEGDPKIVLDRIWRIGGNTGWYYGNWLWQLRGFIDKCFGGAGLNRGRTHSDSIQIGDAIDFWRVLVADSSTRRLLLYAEMKLPGEAWLEFQICPTENGFILVQKATFRPKGILGRLYWYALLPIHNLIFKRMARAIVAGL